MNWACIALSLLRTLLAIHQKSCEPSFREVMDSSVLVAYASLAVSSILLQQLLASLHLTLDSEDLFCWHKQKIEVISMNCGSSTQSWKPLWWVRLHLIFTMRDTYNNSNLNSLRKFNSSSRSTKFKDIFPWNIFQIIMKTLPISMTILTSFLWNEASCCQFDGQSMETETTTWSEFRDGEEAIVEQVLASDKRNPKEQDCKGHSQISW